jgi:ribosome-binding factor A
MSTHVNQIESVLKRSVQDVLARGLNDPRVRGLVSVTKVDVSPDLAEAVIWCSVLPEEHGPLTVKGIEHAGAWIRRSVASRVSIRRIPRLVFRLDTSLKKQAEIYSAINEGRRRDEELHEQRRSDSQIDHENERDPGQEPIT